MANPQTENGHVDIANEIIEALAKTNLTSYETRILMALFRKTYGWHKKADAISLSQFYTITGILPQHVARTVKQLELRKIIIVQRNGQQNEYQFQKNYEIWDTLLPIKVIPNKVLPDKVLQHEVLPNEDTGTTSLGNQVLPNQVLTKETITKETIQKKDIIYIPLSFIEFNNIKITQIEYDKLLLKFGDNLTKEWILKLSEWKESKGKKTKSDYATILNWARRDNNNGNNKTGNYEHMVRQ